MLLLERYTREGCPFNSKSRSPYRVRRPYGTLAGRARCPTAVRSVYRPKVFNRSPAVTISYYISDLWREDASSKVAMTVCSGTAAGRHGSASLTCRRSG